MVETGRHGGSLESSWQAASGHAVRIHIACLYTEPHHQLQYTQDLAYANVLRALRFKASYLPSCPRRPRCANCQGSPKQWPWLAVCCLPEAPSSEGLVTWAASQLSGSRDTWPSHMIYCLRSKWTSGHFQRRLGVDDDFGFALPCAATTSCCTF